jgi:large subunit ribosomal protein L24
VIKVFSLENRAIVEGVNIVSKHTKPNAASPQGGIIKQESSIHISNLKLVDPSSGKPTKVGRLRDDKTGKLVRFSKTTKEVIK